MTDESTPTLHQPDDMPSWEEVNQAHYLIQQGLAKFALDYEPQFLFVSKRENAHKIQAEVVYLNELTELGFDEEMLLDLWNETKEAQDWIAHEENNHIIIPTRLWAHFQTDLISGQRDVLCWLLGHSNQVFAENLAGLIQALGEMENDERQTATNGDGEVDAPGIAEVQSEPEG